MEATTIDMKLKTKPFSYCQSGISCPVENTEAISAHKNDKQWTEGGKEIACN